MLSVIFLIAVMSPILDLGAIRLDGQPSQPNKYLTKNKTLKVLGAIPGINCVIIDSIVSHRLFLLSDVPEDTMRRFWDLESIGIDR